MNKDMYEINKAKLVKAINSIKFSIKGPIVCL